MGKFAEIFSKFKRNKIISATRHFDVFRNDCHYKNRHRLRNPAAAAPEFRRRSNREKTPADFDFSLNFGNFGFVSVNFAKFGSALENFATSGSAGPKRRCSCFSLISIWNVEKIFDLGILAKKSSIRDRRRHRHRRRRPTNFCRWSESEVQPKWRHRKLLLNFVASAPNIQWSPRLRFVWRNFWHRLNQLEFLHIEPIPIAHLRSSEGPIVFRSKLMAASTAPRGAEFPAANDSGDFRATSDLRRWSKAKKRRCAGNIRVEVNRNRPKKKFTFYKHFFSYFNIINSLKEKIS